MVDFDENILQARKIMHTTVPGAVLNNPPHLQSQIVHPDDGYKLVVLLFLYLVLFESL